MLSKTLGGGISCCGKLCRRCGAPFGPITQGGRRWERGSKAAIGQVWTRHHRSSRVCPMAFMAFSVLSAFSLPSAQCEAHGSSPYLPGRGQGCGLMGSGLARGSGEVGGLEPPPPRAALEGGKVPPPPPRAPSVCPGRQVPGLMAFVTDSNRPQPLWQPPPTACLTASGAASEALSRLMHPCL